MNDLTKNYKQNFGHIRPLTEKVRQVLKTTHETGKVLFYAEGLAKVYFTAD